MGAVQFGQFKTSSGWVIRRTFNTASLDEPMAKVKSRYAPVLDTS